MASPCGEDHPRRQIASAHLARLQPRSFPTGLSSSALSTEDSLPRLSSVALVSRSGIAKKVQELNGALDAIRAKAPIELAQMLILENSKELIPSRVLERGNPGMQAQIVPRRFLRFFSVVTDQPFQQGSGRLELAQAIVSPANPMTSRVLVNRIWQQHFGQGIVTTPSDFGMQSIPPSHPQLLDHLVPG